MTSPSAMIPGRVYRTRELRAFTANPSRWARRLVERGALRQVSHGLYYVPVPSRFGPVSATTEEVLRAFLGSEDFLITGPYFWNGLGLGTTQMFAVTMVYNHERTGEILLEGRRFWFRRVRFPSPPPVEWFIVDLLHNEHHMGEDTSRLSEDLDVKLGTDGVAGLPPSPSRAGERPPHIKRRAVWFEALATSLVIPSCRVTVNHEMDDERARSAAFEVHHPGQLLGQLGPVRRISGGEPVLGVGGARFDSRSR